MGGAIEDSLDLLADHPAGGTRHVGLRVAALGLAAAVGAILVLGHGLVLP